MNRLLRALPNLVTLLRLIAVPVTVHVMLLGRLDWAFWVFLAAGLSDGLDGLLARRLRAQSLVGSYLDPLADKLLLNAVFVCLGLQAILPLWLVALVVIRDCVLVVGAAAGFVRDRHRPLKPLVISKANTACQITLVAWSLLAHGLLWPAALEGPAGWVTPILIGLVAATTSLSGLAYLSARLAPERDRPKRTGPERAG